MQNKFSRIAAHGGARKKELRVLAASAAVVAATVAAQQLPAHATASGLTFYPSTDIYGKGNIHFDADYFSRSGTDTSATSLGLSYGLGPEKDGALGRTELGFDYVTSGSGISAGKRLLFNIKTQLFNNDKSGTRVVAGFWGVGARGNIATGQSVFPPNVGYLLGSKNFSFGRLHLGVAHSFAKKDVLATPGGNADRTYLQLGYDKLFANNKFQFTADFYSGKSSISTFSPGLIYYPNNRSDFQIGLIHYNDSTVAPSRNQIYVGFDYNFSGGGDDNVPDPVKKDESATKGASENGTTPAANAQP